MGGLIAITLSLATIFPMWRIAGRAGLNPLWALLCVIPFGVIVLLWIIAFRPWPGERA